MCKNLAKITSALYFVSSIMLPVDEKTQRAKGLSARWCWGLTPAQLRIAIPPKWNITLIIPSKVTVVLLSQWANAWITSGLNVAHSLWYMSSLISFSNFLCQSAPCKSSSALKCYKIPYIKFSQGSKFLCKP